MVIFRYCITVFVVFMVGFFLLCFPEKTTSGIKQGLEISAEVLIPTLFPFLVFSSLIVNSNLCMHLSSLFGRITKLLFGQSEHCFTVFIMSVIGGYPVGGSMVNSLYEKGDISRDEGQRMLLFCFNAAPSFVISTVGYGMLKSQKLGLIINISVILSSLIVGILTRFIKSDKQEYLKSSTGKNSNENFSQTLINSVSQSVNSMLMICTWVILFTCIINLSEIFTDSKIIRMLICSVCEVTTGCRNLCSDVPLPVIAGIISFGGLCTHLQVMSAIIKLKLRYLHFFTSRIIGAALSMVICQGIINIFPQAAQVVALGEKPIYTEYTTSFTITVALIVLCALMILGDNFTFIIENNKH